MPVNAFSRHVLFHVLLMLLGLMHCCSLHVCSMRRADRHHLAFWPNDCVFWGQVFKFQSTQWKWILNCVILVPCNAKLCRFFFLLFLNITTTDPLGPILINRILWFQIKELEKQSKPEILDHSCSTLLKLQNMKKVCSFPYVYEPFQENPAESSFLFLIGWELFKQCIRKWELQTTFFSWISPALFQQSSLGTSRRIHFSKAAVSKNKTPLTPFDPS